MSNEYTDTALKVLKETADSKAVGIDQRLWAAELLLRYTYEQNN